jgi:hypothetical protein
VTAAPTALIAGLAAFTPRAVLAAAEVRQAKFQLHVQISST